MKAAVLLCLLHAAFIETQKGFSWPKPDTGSPSVVEKYGCESNRAMCGCCLMQHNIKRFENFFDLMLEELHKELSSSQMTLNHIRGNHSVFSVALSNNPSLECFGPSQNDAIISFDDVFINIGNSYSVSTGIFTVPCSGVYSLSVTLYINHHPFNTSPICARLEVNGKVVASLPTSNGSDDREDSSSEVMAIKLKTGDQVTVILPAGCVVCDDDKHMTVFTGFLLYATD